MNKLVLRMDKTLLATRFGNRAETYDAVTPVQALMAESLLRQALNHFSSHQKLRILELGCGTGRLTGQLATVFPQADITALDISKPMIQFAKQRNPNVNHVVADAETFLRHTSPGYDLIISNAAAQWFEDPTTALTQAYEKLTAHGILLLSTFGAETFNELRQAFRHAYGVTGLPITSHMVPLKIGAEWRQMLPNAEMTQQSISRPFANVRQFLRSVQQAGAVNSMLERQYLRRQVLREMTAYYATHFPDKTTGGVTATYQVIYLCCRKT